MARLRPLLMTLPLVACGTGSDLAEGEGGSGEPAVAAAGAAAADGPEGGPGEPAQPAAPEPGAAGGAHPDDPEGWAALEEYAGEAVVTVREVWPSGELRRIATHLAGRGQDPDGRHGPEWTFFKNGFKKETLTFERGVAQGPFTRAWQNGQLRFQGTFVDGERHGEFLQWFQTGDLQMHFQYDQGVPTGVWREWYVELAPKSEESYVDGKLHGERQLWDKPMTDPDTGEVADGILTRVEQYEEGELHGSWQDYHPRSGAPRTSGSHVRGLKVGRWETLMADGTVVDESDYDDEGRRTGLQKLYAPDGTLIQELTWVEGAQSGPARQFFPDGSPHSEGEYLEGLRTGAWRFYTSGGELSGFSGVYANDERVGDLPDDAD